MGWFERLFGRQEKSSSVAKNRLQMVLTHDRTDISPGLIEQIKDDMIEVIARHLAVDPDAVVVQLTTTAKESRLVAEIPIPGNKRRQIE
jgi:cell division topological specificity factor